MSTYFPDTATWAIMRRFSVKPGFSISSGVWQPRHPSASSGGGQGRFHAWLGMTGGALRVPRERGEDALLVELVAERAVGAEAGGRINARLLIDVHVVRELKQDGARRFVARERLQIAQRRRAGNCV